MTTIGMSRAQTFWLLQLAGWSGYAASKLLAFPMTLVDAAWVAGKGVLLTCAIRAALRRLERLSPPTTALIVAAVLLALLAASTSLALSYLLSARGWLLTAPGSLAWLGSIEGHLYEFLLFLAWTALYLGIRRALDLRTEQQRLREALAQAQRARAQMLRLQLNPHFLFNALTSLRALVGEDPARAERTITDLSGFLRYSLLDAESETTTLAREFDVIRHYLAIQKVRFEERIDYSVELDPGVAHWRLPTFLIQPLVENAVKYGMRTCRGDTAHIQVSARRDGDHCRLRIHNNGRWIARDEPGPADLDRSGIGLSNLRARLAEQVKHGYRFTIGPADDGVLASLEFDAA